MTLGLSIQAFTALHVAITLIGILSGLVALIALARGRWLNGWQTLFLITTALTSITGFMFPFNGFTPAIGVGIISTVILAAAFFALYVLRLRGRARTLYAVTATLALYFNLFVLVVQSFLKIPPLHTLAPSGSEPPFAVVQGIVLLASLWLGWKTVRAPAAVAA